MCPVLVFNHLPLRPSTLLLYLLPPVLSTFGVPDGRCFSEYGSAQPRCLCPGPYPIQPPTKPTNQTNNPALRIPRSLGSLIKSGEMEPSHAAKAGQSLATLDRGLKSKVTPPRDAA